MLNAIRAAVLVILTSTSALANPEVRTFRCNLDTDASRGVRAVRAYLDLTSDGESACLRFVDYVKRPPVVLEGTCGSRNRAYGVRKDGQNKWTQRFDGFADFTDKSRISIPLAKRRFAIIDNSGYERQVVIRGDRKRASDLELVCSR